MPTEDPRRAGFTITRRPGASAANASSSASTPDLSVVQRIALISIQGRTGSPAPRAIRLKNGLSMPTADAAIPAPV